MNEYNYCANCANAECRKFYVHPCPSCVHGNKEWFELADGREPPPCSGWISVKDRLPEHVGDYLVCDAENDEMDLAHFATKKGKFGRDGYWCAPTHWMPLPAPPTPYNEDNGR